MEQSYSLNTGKLYKFMENRKHRCIISCEICLKEHREILNRIDRALEFLEAVGDSKNEIAQILRGESH